MKKKKKKISSKRMWERRRKIRGLKYMECAFLLSSLAICAHISYTKILLLLSKGREIKKKGKGKRKVRRRGEKKKMHWGWWVPTTFVSLCVGLETWRMAWTKSLLLFLFTSLMGLPLYRLPEIDDSSSSLSFKSQQYFSLFFSWYFLPVYSMCSSVSRIIQCTCRFDWKRIFNFD